MMNGGYLLSHIRLFFHGSEKIDHFQHAHGGVVTFVAALCAGTFNGLFDAFRGDDAEADG